MATVSANNGDSAPTHLLNQTTVHSTDHVSTVARKKCCDRKTAKCGNSDALHIACTYLQLSRTSYMNCAAKSDRVKVKLICDGQQPTCSVCGEDGVACVFNTSSTLQRSATLQQSQICKLAQIYH